MNGAVLDTSLLTTLIDMTKSCMGLFTEFPLNIILIGSLSGVAFGLFCKAKRAAR